MIRKKGNPNLGGALQLSFLMPESNWSPPNLADLPSWDGAKRVSIDAETCDPHLRDLGVGVRRGGYATGWSFTIEGGPSHYLPMRHEGGDNLPTDQVIRYMRDNLKNFEGEIVGAHLPYEIEYANADGIEFNPNAIFRDVQIADPLIYELHPSFSLESIGERWGVASKDKGLLTEAARAMGLDPGQGMWRLPARFVGPYAERDTASPLELYAKMREVLDKDQLWQVFDMESTLLPILVKMRQRGVRIDFERLDRIENQAAREEREMLDFIHRETSVRIGFGDVWKPKAIAPALESVGIRVGRTRDGAPSINAALLESSDHPVLRAVRHARKVNKLRTTFAASIRKYATNGRIHCTFNQIAREDEDGDQKGVRYGRLSATDPNLQQQFNPEKVRDDDPQLLLEWRKIFLPEDGSLWGCNDYSQQEPRWTTHYAALMGLPKAEEAAKRYRDNPDADNHDMMTRLIHGDALVDEWLAIDPKKYKTERGYAKIIFLGLCYGEGGYKLCLDLKLPTRWALITGYGRSKVTEYFESRHAAYEARMEQNGGFVKEVAGLEAQNILDNFDAEVPYVRKLARAASDRAEAVGYVKTVMGRRLHFDKRDDGSYDWTHKALNRIIQGTSADQTKKALIDLDREGHYIQLQVHDDVNGSFSDVASVKRAGQIMRESIREVCEPLVPFKVDSEYGPNWGDLKKAA